MSIQAIKTILEAFNQSKQPRKGRRYCVVNYYRTDPQTGCTYSAPIVQINKIYTSKYAKELTCESIGEITLKDQTLHIEGFHLEELDEVEINIGDPQCFTKLANYFQTYQFRQDPKWDEFFK